MKASKLMTMCFVPFTNSANKLRWIRIQMLYIISRIQKKIKGPVIGMDIKTLILVNKTNKGDTLKVTIYGNKNKYFRIGKDFYQARNPIFSVKTIHNSE